MKKSIALFVILVTILIAVNMPNTEAQSTIGVEDMTPMATVTPNASIYVVPLTPAARKANVEAIVRGGLYDDLNVTDSVIYSRHPITVAGNVTVTGAFVGNLPSHLHAGVAGDGGKLDWDSVWSDAVHSHASNAEGGTFDAANLTSGASTDGQVLTSDGAGAAAWEDVAAAAEYPKRCTMWHDESTVLTGNPFLQVATALEYYNIYAYQNAAANGDTFSNGCALAAGVYTLSALGLNGTTRGVIDWYAGGSLIENNQDWYNAGGTTYNIIKVSSPFTLTADGYYAITGTIDGKNAGSSGYTMPLTKYWIKQAND